MDFKQYCLGIIKSAIRIEVLNLAFYNRNFQDNMMSLEYKISSRALEPRFFLDINMISGVEENIKLSDCNIISYTDSTTLIQIPQSILNGRKLINVLNLTASYDYEEGNDSTIGGVAMSSFKQMLPSDNYINTRIEKISDNEVLLYKQITVLSDMNLKVILSYSESFNEISNNFYPSLALTALESVKLYIYNTLAVKSSESHLYNGYEMQIISDTINDYAESFNVYMDLIDKKTKKQLYMADRVRMRNYTKISLGKLR